MQGSLHEAGFPGRPNPCSHQPNLHTATTKFSRPAQLISPSGRHG
jgi:hypothetical protein